MRSASLLVAAIVAVLTLHFGRAAVGGYVIADRSYGEDVYHLGLLYERWGAYVGDGFVPAWMPEFAGGYPAPASWMYGLLYPGLLLFAVLPPAAAMTWTGILHIAFGALGMWHLTRAHGCGREGACTAALVFALSEFMVGRMLCGHVNLIMPLAWVPWILWQVHRSVRGDRYAVPLLAATTALGLVSGHVQLWFYIVPLAGLLVCAWWRERAPGAAVRLALAAVLAVALSAPQWLATLELVASSGPTSLPEGMLGFAAAPPLHVAARALPGALGARAGVYWGGEELEHEFLFVGGAWLVLLVALALRGRGRLTLVWAAAACVAFLLAVRAPWTELLYAVPPFTFARTPGRALVVVVLAVSVLAGLGVDRWLATEDANGGARLRRLRIPGGAALLVLVAGLVVVGATLYGEGAVVDTSDGPLNASAVRGLLATVVLVSVSGLAAVTASLVFTRSEGWRRWLPVVAVGAAAWSAAPPVEVVSAEFLRTDWSRALPASVRGHRMHLDGNRFPEVERSGMRTLRELCHVDTAGYRAIWEPPAHGTAYWLDVGALAIRPWEGNAFEPPRDLARLVEVESVAHVGPAAVFEREGEAVPMADADVVAALRAGDPRLHVAHSDGTVSRHRAQSAGRARRLHEADPCRVSFEYATDRPAWLFVSEKDYPGWRALLGDEELEIHTAAHALRAVEVPAGTHTVSFVYEPRAFRVGGWLVLVGLLSCAGLTALDARRRQA